MAKLMKVTANVCGGHIPLKTGEDKCFLETDGKVLPGLEFITEQNDAKKKQVD